MGSDSPFRWHPTSMRHGRAATTARVMVIPRSRHPAIRALLCIDDVSARSGSFLDPLPPRAPVPKPERRGHRPRAATSCSGHSRSDRRPYLRLSTPPFTLTREEPIFSKQSWSVLNARQNNCWDNAVAESFFTTLKNEEATGVYGTKAAAHAAIASYIHGFYNPTRLHSALDYLSPNDYAKKLKQVASTDAFWRPCSRGRFM